MHWQEILQMIEACYRATTYDKAYTLAELAGEKALAYLNQQDMQTFTNYIKELLQYCKDSPLRQPNWAIDAVLPKLIWRLTPDRCFLFVKLALHCLAQDLEVMRDENGQPILLWEGLLYFFAAQGKAGRPGAGSIHNFAQARQLRMLAKKLLTTHPCYSSNPPRFVYELLVLIPEKMRLNRLERIRWFRSIRKPTPRWFLLKDRS